MPSEADICTTTIKEYKIAKKQREQACDKREIQKYKEEREAYLAEEACQHKYY